MDTRLIAVIDRLSEDLANLEKALIHTQELLKELVKEGRKNNKTVNKRLDTIQATQRFMANGHIRREGAFPHTVRREVGHDD